MKTENEEEASYFRCIYFHLYKGNLPLIKSNEFSEKFQTAFVPPSFSYNCIADIWGNLQYNLLDQKVPLPLLNFSRNLFVLPRGGFPKRDLSTPTESTTEDNFLSRGRYQNNNLVIRLPTSMLHPYEPKQCQSKQS